MFYRLMTALMFNNNIDFTVDKALNDGLLSGVKKIEAPHKAFSCVSFNNGTVFTYWNNNKYSSWMSEGTFVFENGNVYKYVDGRPSAKVMYRMICALRNFDYSK